MTYHKENMYSTPFIIIIVQKKKQTDVANHKFYPFTKLYRIGADQAKSQSSEKIWFVGATNSYSESESKSAPELNQKQNQH